MPRPRSRLSRWLAELRRRRVPRVLVVYLTAALVILQGVQLLQDALGVPAAALRLLTYAAMAGIPVAAILAWYFEVVRDRGKAGTVAAAGPADADGPAAPSRWRRWLLPWGAAVLVVAVAAVWTAYRHRRGPPSVPAATPERVAVLYFQDLSPSGDLGYLAEWLTQQLIDELSSVDALQVAPESAVRPYRAGGVALDSIGRALRIDLVVGGSITASVDSLRLRVYLADARRAIELDDTVVEQRKGDLFGLQAEVSDDVARFLRQRMGREVLEQQWRSQTRGVAALEAVLRARNLREQIMPRAAGDPAAILELSQDSDALAWCAETQRRFPDAGVTCRLQLWGWSPTAEPDVDSAWAALNDLVPVSPQTYATHLAMVAAVAARAGLVDSARAILRRARSQVANASGPDFAAAAAALGDRREALRWLATFLELHPNQRGYIAASRRFMALHGDSTFDRIYGTTRLGR
jgi:TolB-like protein